MAKGIAAEKAMSEPRRAALFSNVTGTTKERIAQSKRDRAGSLAIVCLASGANLYPPGVWLQMSCFSSLVLRLFGFCFVFVFLLSLKSRPSIDRSSLLIRMRPDSHMCFFLFRLFFGDVAFSEYFCTIIVFYLYGGIILFVVNPLLLDVRLHLFGYYVDAPAGVTHEGVSPPPFCGACLDFVLIVRRIRSSLFFVDCDIEFCVPTTESFYTCWA